MQLTARDIEVVKAVYAYKFLTQAQIQALLFPSKWAAQYRLIRLYQNRYLNRVFTPVAFGLGKTIYCLDNRGADLVAGQLGVSQDQLDWQRKRARVGWPFLEHALAINDVRIALTLACRASGCCLEEWVDESTLKKEHGKEEERVTLRGAGGRVQRVAVIADGYFVLRCAGRRAHFFIEVDRSTVSNKRWMQKVRAYNAYYQTGRYRAKYGTNSLRILTVTPSEIRLANLKSSTERAGGGKMFWFTRFAEACREGILAKNTWQVAGLSKTESIGLLWSRWGTDD